MSIIDNMQNVISKYGMSYQCSLDDSNTLNDILYNYIDTQKERNDIIEELIKTNSSNHNGISFTYSNKLVIKLDSQYIVDNSISIDKTNNSYTVIVNPIFNIFYKNDKLIVTSTNIQLISDSVSIAFDNDTLFTNNLFDLLENI